MQELKGKILMRINNLNENHNGFQYKDGLNVLNKEFQLHGSCCPGGLYFTTSEHIHNFESYGCWIRIVKLPTDDPDFKCVKDPSGYKWRANKLILCEKIPIFCNDLYEKYNINFKLCRKYDINIIFEMAKNCKKYTITQLFNITSDLDILDFKTKYLKCLHIINELDEGPEKEEYVSVYNIIITVFYLLDINNPPLGLKIIGSNFTKHQFIKALTIYKKINKSTICQKQLSNEYLFSENVKIVDIFCDYFPGNIEKYVHIAHFFGLDDNPGELFILEKLPKKMDFCNCIYKNITSDDIRIYFGTLHKLIHKENIKNILELMRNNRDLVTLGSLMSILKYLNHNGDYRGLIFNVYRLAEKYDIRFHFDIDILLGVLIYYWKKRSSLISCYTYNKLSDNLKYFMSHVTDDDIRNTLDELFSRIPEELNVLYCDRKYSNYDFDYPYYNIAENNCAYIMNIISIRSECVPDQYIQSLLEKFSKILQNKYYVPGFILVYILKLNKLLVNRDSGVRMCPDLISAFLDNINLHLLDETFYRMLTDLEFNIIFKKIKSKYYNDNNRRNIIQIISSKLILHNPTIVKNNIKYLAKIILQNNCCVSCVKKIIKFIRENNLECDVEEEYHKYFINQVAIFGKKNMRKIIKLLYINDVDTEAIIPIILSKFGAEVTIDIFKKYVKRHMDSKKINYEEIIIKNLKPNHIIEIVKSNLFFKNGSEYMISTCLKNNPNIDDKTLEEICSILILNGNVKLLEMVKSITNKIIISKDTADNILKYKQYSKKASFEEKMKFIKMGNIGSSVKWFDSNKSSIIIC